MLPVVVRIMFHCTVNDAPNVKCIAPPRFAELKDKVIASNTEIFVPETANPPPYMVAVLLVNIVLEYSLGATAYPSSISPLSEYMAPPIGALLLANKVIFPWKDSLESRKYAPPPLHSAAFPVKMLLPVNETEDRENEFVPVTTAQVLTSPNTPPELFSA